MTKFGVPKVDGVLLIHKSTSFALDSSRYHTGTIIVTNGIGK
jgi:hypothetical protein